MTNRASAHSKLVIAFVLRRHLRTLGLYQHIESFGVKPDEVRAIQEIRNDCYLYFEAGAGGWPWNEFTHEI